MEYTVTKQGSFEIRNFPILDSTNEEAKRLIKSSRLENTVIIAESQTAGKGRSGREWVSEQGNLFFSIIINSGKLKAPELVTYITALTIINTLKKLGISAQIKWPNDILINSEKLSGILLEKLGEFLIIGVGINIKSSPQYLDNSRTATFLNKYIEIDATRLLNNILNEFEKTFNQFKTSGFGIIKDQVISHLYNYNKNIRLNYLGKETPGIIRGISDEGNLIIENDKTLIEYRTGEIFDL